MKSLWSEGGNFDVSPYQRALIKSSLGLISRSWKTKRVVIFITRGLVINYGEGGEATKWENRYHFIYH